MGPCVHGVAAQGLDVDLLARVQVVEGLGKEVDGVVHQRGLRLTVQGKSKDDKLPVDRPLFLLPSRKYCCPARPDSEQKEA